MIDAYNEMIDDLSRTTTRIHDLTEKFKGDLMAGTAGDWGPSRILAHMIDVEEFKRGRMQLILTEETPYLKPYKSTHRRSDSPGEFRPELEAFATERGETLSLLMNLALKDWERTGIHDTLGELSIEDITERLIDHDNEHLEQMKAALKSKV